MLRFPTRRLGVCLAFAGAVGAFGCAANGNGSTGGFGAVSGSSASSGAAASGSSSSPDATTTSGSTSIVIPGNGDDSSFTVGSMDAASCPSTCDTLGANCGVVFDKFCGGTVTCGECEVGVCGAPMGGADAGVPNVCGTGNGTNPDGSSSCTPESCADQGITCGPAGDGCGKMLDCGNPCVLPQTCGGAKPGVCGCTGVCSQIADCSEAGGTTTLTGVVMDPGAVNPLYNALVYIPNNPADPALSAPLADGITCDVCGASAAGTPLVTTTTKTDGSFTLSGVPVGKGVELVVQLGKWRRIFHVDISNPCGMNTVTGVGNGADGGAPIASGVLTMPKNKGEGDIPLTVVVTGDADALECVLWKAGVDQNEFTNPGAGGRINLVTGSGHDVSTGIKPPGRTNERGWVNTCTSGGGACTTAACPGTCTQNRWGGGAAIDANTPSELALFQNAADGGPAAYPLTQYALAVFSCQGWPWGDAVSLPSLAHYPELVAYANGGGRIFATHFSSAYYTFTAGGVANPFDGTATWGTTGGVNFASDPGGKPAFVDVNPTDNPKGAAFAAWLANAPSALSMTPAWMTMPANAPTVLIDPAKWDTTAVIPPTQQWMFMSPNDDDTHMSPTLFTFNTPIGAANTAQCGRGLYTDFHVTPNTAGGGGLEGTHTLIFPAECGPRSPMSAQEKVLEFILFDLGACVQPYKPVCTPTTCAAQNLMCGAAGDGCGGALDCGPCPTGETCVRGMCTINATCTPTTCAAQNIQCGPAGDGCGNAIDCGPCPTGEICGYSGPGKCGAAR
jgi:hypothetical protein